MVQWDCSFPRKGHCPNVIDDTVGDTAIADVFSDEFHELYNCVSLKIDDMDVLRCKIDVAIDDVCKCKCMQDNHSINAVDISKAVRKLKTSKRDGSTEIMSDHIIYAGHKLDVYISLLFTTMLRHSMSPNSMVLGTMVPIPKGKWANLTCSDNFRAITLSSILGKILDYIVLDKEASHLCTSYLQFSFKKESSTSQCTSMIQETVSYFVHGGSDVYGLM